MLGITLLAAAASAGWITFWCPAMQESSLHCCCARPAWDPSLPRPDVISRSCCESHQGEALPSAKPDLQASHAVLPAPLVATLPLALVFGAPQLGLSVPRERRHEARIGPPPRVHRESSVFLL